MPAQAIEAFGHEDRERIYEYLTAHGPADVESVGEALGLDASGIRHHVAILKRDGYLYEHAGMVDVGFDPTEFEGEERSFSADDLEYVIRRAGHGDLGPLVDAMRAVTEGGSYVVAESVADIIDYEDVVLQHDALRSRMVFVAVAEEEVVGWVHLQSPESPRLHHTAELTVGVREPYRNHGVGSHLLERALEWAEAEGFEKLYNSVPSSNQAAIDFLESHDWEVEAVREDHYRVDDDYVDEVMMAYRL